MFLSLVQASAQQIHDVVQAAPPQVFVTVQQPTGLPEWVKIIISASVGALFAVLGSVVMEFIKPKIARRQIALQLMAEVKRNLDYLKKVDDVIKASSEGEQLNVHHAEYLISNVWDDRFRHYMKDQPILVYQIDRHKSLEELYQMAKVDLPAALIKGDVYESIAGPGTAAEIVTWAIHWGSCFVEFQSRPFYSQMLESSQDYFRAKLKGIA
ncbi:MAG TPA: hypothetical protein VK638_51555 [Edaphobacter sp.]|nr:hypothetical protein [Edaphobacter sp.]